MSSAALEVQTAIFAILDADVTLSALVTGVFDDVPESYTDFPYVTLGEDVLTEFDTDGVLGFRVSLTIHCWSQYKGQRETKLVQDAIYRALHHVSMRLAGYTMILSRQVDQTGERDPDGMTRHGVQTFELLVRSLSILSPAHPDLTAFYTMDSISGATLFDESPNNNDATITGAVAVAGHIGNALQFSGAPDHVATPVTHSGTTVSVSLWLNPSDVLSRRFIFADNSIAGTLEEIRVALGISGTTGKYEIIVGDGTLSFRDTGSFSHSLVVGTYLHIVYIVNGSNVLIYEDSVLKHTIPIGFTVGATPAGSTWTLGRVGDLGGAELIGDIDHCRRYNLVLTQSEIDELFNSGVGA
jgi:hypothetical protein